MTLVTIIEHLHTLWPNNFPPEGWIVYPSEMWVHVYQYTRKRILINKNWKPTKGPFTLEWINALQYIQRHPGRCLQQWGKALVCSICQCLWRKYSHCGQFQAPNMVINQLAKFLNIQQWALVSLYKLVPAHYWVDSYFGIWDSNKIEWTPAPCTNMDKSHKYNIEQNKQISKECIEYDSIYMKFKTGQIKSECLGMYA